MILAVVKSRHDPRTLDAWGHVLGASRGTIRSWCYAARMSPKASLDFGRLLRAIIRAQGLPWDLQELLDIVNERTVKSLLTRAGFPDLGPLGSPPSLDAFLERQRLVPRAAGLDMVKTLVRIEASALASRRDAESDMLDAAHCRVSWHSTY